MKRKLTVAALLAALIAATASCFAQSRSPASGDKKPNILGEPFTKLRMTKLYNLMQDPYERADITSNTYWDWIINHVPQVYQGMEGVTTFVASFKEYPKREFELMVRLYGPTKAFFDKQWTLSDIEEVR
jgi:hypothetical protein